MNPLDLYCTHCAAITHVNFTEVLFNAGKSFAGVTYTCGHRALLSRGTVEMAAAYIGHTTAYREMPRG